MEVRTWAGVFTWLFLGALLMVGETVVFVFTFEAVSSISSTPSRIFAATFALFAGRRICAGSISYAEWITLYVDDWVADKRPEKNGGEHEF